MRKKRTPVLLLFVIAGVAALGAALLWGTNVAVLNPKGAIARDQFELIIFTSLLSLVVVLPVFGLMFYISWKYRASNTTAAYHPNWDRNRIIEAVWWLIPLALITVLAIITWVTTHKLDPFRPIDSNKKPVTIQVIALQWKWLFIYPEEDIATVNHIRFPVDTPVNFEITSDAPMNSFWIPQLGGQVYAMAGMQTKLHLIADKTGTYNGVSANISGAGFSDMTFTASATTQKEYEEWLRLVKQSPKTLDKATYEIIAEPTKANPVDYYSSSENDLYTRVIDKYMMPGNQNNKPEHVGHE